MSHSIAIIDLGGQYCHLISRRLRDLGVWSEIHPPTVRSGDLSDYAGVILSGGPRSVYESDAPAIDRRILDLGIPVLGICYGHQLLAKELGARVASGSEEYGHSRLHLHKADTLFRGTPADQTVWMSHSDSVSRLPRAVTKLASTDHCSVAAFADLKRRLFGVQFHPEVVHTPHGVDMLRNFALTICGLEPMAGVSDRVATLVERIRHRVGDKSVFFFVSGGVDSTVAFALCSRALAAHQLLGVYVDTGLMREGETAELQANMAALGLTARLTVRDESERFLSALQRVTDPEKKRRVIGRAFVQVQAQGMREYGIDEGNWLLGQGTIYPDTIESGGTNGAAALIKTHHNRCQEIQRLLERGLVLEPLAEFYKDEVRQIGAALGLDAKLTKRWPFPGPGLAIRCLCTGRARGKARPLQLASSPNYEAIRLPLRSVGVQGDSRTYRDVVALRGPLEYDALQQVSSELCNIGRSHNRVIVQIAGKPASLKGGVITANKTLTRGRLDLLRKADYLARSGMEKAGLTDAVWQFPVVLIPLSFTGGETIVLRPVNSQDGMTANFARLSPAVLGSMGEAIASLPGVDAVFLDVTDKPPATIEWE